MTRARFGRTTSSFRLALILIAGMTLAAAGCASQTDASSSTDSPLATTAVTSPADAQQPAAPTIKDRAEFCRATHLYADASDLTDRRSALHVMRSAVGGKRRTNELNEALHTILEADEKALTASDVPELAPASALVERAAMVTCGVTIETKQAP